MPDKSKQKNFIDVMYASYRISALKIDLLEMTEYFYIIGIKRWNLLILKHIDISGIIFLIFEKLFIWFLLCKTKI